MNLLRHWLATSPRYSVDPLDARILPTEDEAEQYREQGWTVDGPYIEAAPAQGAVAEIATLRDVLSRIAAGHAHPSKLAGEVLDADPSAYAGGR